MNTIKSSKNFEASNSSNFENDTNYITQKQFFTKKISSQGPNFESDEFTTFKKSNTLNNSNNNITATFYKKSKNSNEVKDEDLYINERRKKKVLNMIKNAHVEKLKNFIYLKEINFAYEEMQRYYNEGDFASAKEMERYLNSIQMDIIRHNIESFSRTKLGRSHATFGQSYNSNFSTRKKNVENNKYEQEENINDNKAKKKHKIKNEQKGKYNNNMIINNQQNNINQMGNSKNYKNNEYEYNIPPKSYINDYNINENNIPINENENNNYQDNMPQNQINYNYNDQINNKINEENKDIENEQNINFDINNNNINENNIEEINEENPNEQEQEQEINHENEQELNQELSNNDNINNLNQNQKDEMENIDNNPDNINQNLENEQINNNYIPLNENEEKPIVNIPKENQEYPSNENNTLNQINQPPNKINVELPLHISKISNPNPEKNYQKPPNQNYNQMIQDNTNNNTNNNIYPQNDNVNDNSNKNNIPFNPDNAIPNNKYPNYEDINNLNPNLNRINYSQIPEKDFNIPYYPNKNPKQKEILRHPRTTKKKPKRPKSSKAPMIDINNNYMPNVPNFTYPRKYYELNENKIRNKSGSRNRSNTPKILFAEPSRGRCFACDVNCSISRSGNSPNKYVPYFGPLKKERKHITEYDGEKYGYYQYKSRIPENI